VARLACPAVSSFPTAGQADRATNSDQSNVWANLMFALFVIINWPFVYEPGLFMSFLAFFLALPCPSLLSLPGLTGQPICGPPAKEKLSKIYWQYNWDGVYLGFINALGRVIDFLSQVLFFCANNRIMIRVLLNCLYRERRERNCGNKIAALTGRIQSKKVKRSASRRYSRWFF